jgi:hypothetical protein
VEKTAKRNKLQAWMQKASPAEKVELAKGAGTTIGTLRQVAGAYRTEGKLRCGALLAIALSGVSHRMHGRNPKLPVLKASDFCVELKNL